MLARNQGPKADVLSKDETQSTPTIEEWLQRTREESSVRMASCGQTPSCILRDLGTPSGEGSGPHSQVHR